MDERKPPSQAVRLTPEAAAALDDLRARSGLSGQQLASEAILAASHTLNREEAIEPPFVEYIRRKASTSAA